MKMSAYQKRAYEQGKAWVNGDSKHNPIDDECTPDFSCCVPELFEPEYEKRLVQFNHWCQRHGWPVIAIN